MTHMHKAVRRRIMVAALVAVCGLAVTGCTTDDHSLPSLKGGDQASQGSGLEAVAKKYYDCMSGEGIPVEIAKNGQGEMSVVSVASGHTVLQRDADGAGMSNYGGDREPTEAERKEEEEFFNSTSTEPVLKIDGVDHSEVYARCLNESGYKDSEAWGEIQMDPAEMQRTVTASNQWAACARQNGWPNIKDAVMPTKTDGSEWPRVELPITITEDQLRQLIAVCPTFDADKQKEQDDWWKSHPEATTAPEDFAANPSISFDQSSFPGWGDPNWTPSPEDQAQMDRVGKLYEILYQQSNEYYESTMEGDGSVSASESAEPK